MFTLQPPDVCDRLLDASDQALGLLRATYPGLDQAIGEENFPELRDGTAKNTYALTLVAPSINGCIGIKKYIEYLIPALESIGSSALESFSVVYEVFNKTSDDYEEQVYYTHNFMENK